MAELKEGLWITQATRFVTIDFAVYNVNINLFCITKWVATCPPILSPAFHHHSLLIRRLTFEFPATGGVIPGQQFTTAKLIKFVDKIDYLLMATEFMFYLFIFYYCVEELLEMKASRMQYFYQMSNWMDLGVIAVSEERLIRESYTTYLALCT